MVMTVVVVVVVEVVMEIMVRTILKRCYILVILSS